LAAEELQKVLDIHAPAVQLLRASLMGEIRKHHRCLLPIAVALWATLTYNKFGVAYNRSR
jgi:hypothetical protein